MPNYLTSRILLQTASIFLLLTVTETKRTKWEDKTKERKNATRYRRHKARKRETIFLYKTFGFIKNSRSMTFYASDSLSHDHFCSWSCLQYAVTAVPVKIRL